MKLCISARRPAGTLEEKMTKRIGLQDFISPIHGQEVTTCPQIFLTMQGSIPKSTCGSFIKIIKTMIFMKLCTNYELRIRISPRYSYIIYIVMFDRFEFGVWLSNNFLTLTLVKCGNHLILWIILKSIMLRTFLSTNRFTYLQNNVKNACIIIQTYHL